MINYYDRQPAIHLDGTPIFQTKEDEENQRRVAARLEKAWKCNLHQFGKLSAIDWYGERHGRPVGLLELKCRPHASDKYPTVFLNVRKWLALLLGSVGMGYPAIFVVELSDGLFWIPLRNVDAGRNTIAGGMAIVRSRAEIEPIIEIPVADLIKRRVG